MGDEARLSDEGWTGRFTSVLLVLSGSKGFFVRLVETTFSSAKKQESHDTDSAQTRYRTSVAHGARAGGVLANPSGHGQVARVPGGLRLAFQPPRDRTVDDSRTETKLICVPLDRTATIV